jgi:hypothetical protein
MYLVSPDYLKGKAKQLPLPPPSVSQEAKMPGTPPLPKKTKKKRTNNKKSKRVIKKKIRSSDEWVKLRAKLQEADFERKREIKTNADFLKKKVLHASTFEQKVLQKI